MILDKPVALNVVQAFRGVVDFYTWKGINVARAWPKPPNQPNTPAQVATRVAFANSHTWRKANPVSWHEQWQRMSVPSNMTTEDMKRKTALNLSYAGALVTPPDIINVTVSYDGLLDQTTVTVHLSPTAPYTSGLVTFHSLPYADTPPPLTYSVTILGMDRHDMPIIRHTPVLSTYKPPLSISYDGGSHEHAFVLTGNHPRVAFYPYPTSLGVTDNMLGALYYSTDYP